MNPCERLHRLLSPLRVFSYPFSSELFPTNGIIVMSERGQVWGHGGDEMRIVHVGTHKNGNLVSRLSEQFLLDGRKMDFTAYNAAPKDRSILRKSIGRALLNKTHDQYLATWDIDFTKRVNRERYASTRDINKEKAIEWAITDYMRSKFSFRIVPVSQESDRMGAGSLKSHIIASVAQCECCCPTPDWLGNYAPDNIIARFGLWQVQHTRGDVLNEEDFEFLVSVTSEVSSATVSKATPA